MCIRDRYIPLSPHLSNFHFDTLHFFRYITNTCYSLTYVSVNTCVVGHWHSAINSICQKIFDNLVYFHELLFFHSHYSLDYLTIIQWSVVLTFETPEKEWNRMFWMTARATWTKTFIIAEEQHVNIDCTYSITSFLRQERRESTERSNSSINVLVSFLHQTFSKKKKIQKERTGKEKLS